jgi:hypothetical protein
MIGTHHHTQLLLDEMESCVDFYPGLALNHNPPDFCQAYRLEPGFFIGLIFQRKQNHINVRRLLLFHKVVSCPDCP